MALVDEILAANKKFCENPPVNYEGEDIHKSKLPSKHLAIVTCMDTRLTSFLEPALGIGRGDAKIIKTAGNTVTGVFDSTVRSLLVCIYELGVQEIFVIGHLECGMAKTTAESLTKAMSERGISQDAIRMIHKELAEWADEFQHPEENVKDAVAKLRMNPLIPKDIKIHGGMFHPRTGELELLIRGE